MKKRADYILDKLKKSGSQDNDVSNKQQFTTRRGQQNIEKIKVSDIKINTAKDVRLSLADYTDKEYNPDKENKSSSYCSIIERSPENSRPYIDPKTFLASNNNEINVQNKIEDIAQKPNQLELSSSQQDVLRNNTPQSTRSSSSSSSSSRSSSTSSTSSSSGCMSNSNANSIIDGPSTSKCTGQIVSSRPTKNYHQSPLNSDESDVDLSDSDPTYTIDKPIRSEHVRISESSPSSSSSAPSRSSSRASRDNGESVPEVTRRSRKRTRNPSKWKQNVAKRLRNSGKSYVSSITKKEVPARSIKGVCECKLKCSENINDTHRQTLFDRYWSIGNVDLQRSYIRSCMMEIKPKYKYTNAEKPRLPNNAFYFTVNNNRIRVCKTFYINTLGISDRQIRTVKQKTDPHGFVSTDNRGKHTSRKPTDPLLIEQIKQHIESIPRIESHFLRDSTSREYFTDSSEPVSAFSENGSTSREFISGEKTITELWRDFVKFQTEKGEPTCEYWLYYDIFNKEFNIGFFQPKKDRCNLCMEYELGTPQYKLSIQKKFEDHMNEKEWCRQEKRLDRQNINETNLCAVYDLQAVLQCPTGDTSAFFYKSKLNCLNFTIVQMLKKADPTHDTNDRTAEQVIGAYDNVYSYFWDELQGKRGANEIGSCIFDYLKRLNDQNPNKQLNVIFYSDNCCGQNKNKYIASLYSYAVTCFENIHTITHKYLIKGHTQNEGDNVHSLIEKEIKRNKKSGPIYTPYQYVTLIKKLS